MPLVHRTFGGTPWFLKRPWGFVARARFEQIDTERRAWQRWCEEAEAKLATQHAAQHEAPDDTYYGGSGA